jgi:hypothetical protein
MYMPHSVATLAARHGVSGGCCNSGTLCGTNLLLLSPTLHEVSWLAIHLAS